MAYVKQLGNELLFHLKALPVRGLAAGNDCVASHTCTATGSAPKLMMLAIPPSIKADCLPRYFSPHGGMVNFQRTGPSQRSPTCREWHPSKPSKTSMNCFCASERVSKGKLHHFRQDVRLTKTLPLNRELLFCVLFGSRRHNRIIRCLSRVFHRLPDIFWSPVQVSDGQPCPAIRASEQ